MARRFLRRLRPTQALVHDAVDATNWLIDEGHESTARSVVGALSLVPGLQRPAQAVDGVRRGITRGVLGSVRGVNRLVQGASELVHEATALHTEPEPTVPMRSDTLISADGAVDQLVGVLNGFVGDHLAESGNGLDLGLRLRIGEDWVEADLPLPEELTGRVVVLVHGLSTTELSWSFEAEQAFGGPELNLGTLLARDLGFTPVFVRYNTGRLVEDNGRALAEALATLLGRWPVELERLVLVGHSMGGLVSRAASSEPAARTWLPLLSDVVCLGSPHRGAPLARLGQAAAELFQTVDLPATQVVGRVLAHRSEGVKDLACASLEACGPVHPNVRYLLVAGSVTMDPEGFAAEWLGDLLVPVNSAHGPEGPQVSTRHLPGVLHHRLQTDAGVYAAVREHLAQRRLRSTRRPPRLRGRAR